MRGKFFFVVLGLCFFVVSGCAAVAYLEIKNSAHRDVKLHIHYRQSIEQKHKSVEVEKGETKTVEFELETGFFNRKGEAYVSIAEKDPIIHLLGATSISTENTVSVEIIGYIKECPESKMIGTWENADQGYSIRFENSNKCKIIKTNFSVTHFGYDYEEWKIQNDEIYFRPWLDIDLKGSEKLANDLWISRAYKHIDSSILEIGGIVYTKK